MDGFGYREPLPPSPVVPQGRLADGLRVTELPEECFAEAGMRRQPGRAAPALQEFSDIMQEGRQSDLSKV